MSLSLPSPPSYLLEGHHLTLWQVLVLAKPSTLLNYTTKILAGRCTCQAPHLISCQVPVLAKLTILPPGRSLYLPNSPNYLLAGRCTCQAPHLTLWQVPALAKPIILFKYTAKPTILPHGRSLCFASPPSYLMSDPCTWQAHNLPLWQWHVLAKPISLLNYTAKPTILPPGRALYRFLYLPSPSLCLPILPSPPSYLVQVPVLAKPPILPYGRSLALWEKFS